MHRSFRLDGFAPTQTYSASVYLPRYGFRPRKSGLYRKAGYPQTKQTMGYGGYQAPPIPCLQMFKPNA